MKLWQIVTSIALACHGCGSDPTAAETAADASRGDDVDVDGARDARAGQDADVEPFPPPRPGWCTSQVSHRDDGIASVAEYDETGRIVRAFGFTYPGRDRYLGVSYEYPSPTRVVKTLYAGPDTLFGVFDRTFDEQGRLLEEVSALEANDGALVIESFAYGLDGEVVFWSIDSPTGGLGWTMTSEYDDGGRVIEQAVDTRGDPSAEQRWSWEYTQTDDGLSVVRVEALDLGALATVWEFERHYEAEGRWVFQQTFGNYPWDQVSRTEAGTGTTIQSWREYNEYGELVEDRGRVGGGPMSSWRAEYDSCWAWDDAAERWVFQPQ